jgi:predicted phosphodiesterase
MSDLHFEMHADGGAGLIRELDPTGVDVLVLAGDIFFVCDMAARVRERQPKLWIHGHSHDRCDYLLGRTRVVANPLGYPNEVKSLEAFEPAFHVAV